MPTATFITILREPVDCFESNYVYMGLDKDFGMDVNQFAGSEVGEKLRSIKYTVVAIFKQVAAHLDRRKDSRHQWWIGKVWGLSISFETLILHRTNNSGIWACLRKVGRTKIAF